MLYFALKYFNIMNKKYSLVIAFLCSFLNFSNSFAQSFVTKFEPSNWFIGFKDNTFQVLLYGKDLSKASVSLQNYANVKLTKINKVENPNYLFLDINLMAGAKPGNLKFKIVKDSKTEILNYELKARSNYKTEGVNSQDFIYLLIPDRFSNGDMSNDKFDDMADPNMDRKNPWLRHGGDLKGVENHLDYFKEFGVTALWLNPVSENNQSLTDEGGQLRSAYHGYGITDFYNVDKRLGGNKAYKELIDKAHGKGLKIIQDAVYNHVGINHWILKDLPMKSWLNQWDKYTNTSYKDQPLFDSHASEYDKNVTKNGWFVPFLPDLNQSNPYVAKSLIQQALWNTETFNLDAWRIDTYFYNDLEFMNKCNATLISNFPKIHIFGESWTNSVANQALLTTNNFNLPFKSNLPANVDFQMAFAIHAALNDKPGWNDGVQKLYQVLAQDYLYKEPERLVTFLDNHDLDRFYSIIGEDFEKFKTGISWLMTSRGIPQLYYGTEILMKNFKNPSDAEVRKDFPGGWPDDLENKFNKEGRTYNENQAFEFLKTLGNFRKNSNALKLGNLTQFLPFDDGVYAYFRIYKNEKVMVISNTNTKAKTVTLERFKELLPAGFKLKSIFGSELLQSPKELTINPFQTLIFEINQ